MVIIDSVCVAQHFIDVLFEIDIHVGLHNEFIESE